VQSRRKTLDLEFTDRIELCFETASPELRSAIEQHLEFVASETLATSAVFGVHAETTSEPIDIDGHPLSIGIRRVGGTKNAAGGVA
jgi:hypothetical protein